MEAQGIELGGLLQASGHLQLRRVGTKSRFAVVPGALVFGSGLITGPKV